MNDQQRTEEWYTSRLGHVTGSNAAKLMGTPKAQERYLIELAVEIVTGEPKTFDVPALAWGRKHEASAIRAYQLATGNEVEKVGFIEMTEYSSRESAYVGCSPDGLLDDRGLLEVKCPETVYYHVQNILNGPSKDHVWQCKYNLYATGRQWADFISYHPQMPAKSMLYIHPEPITIDEIEREEIAARINGFVPRLQALVGRLV